MKTTETLSLEKVSPIGQITITTNEPRHINIMPGLSFTVEYNEEAIAEAAGLAVKDLMLFIFSLINHFAALAAEKSKAQLEVAKVKTLEMTTAATEEVKTVGGALMVKTVDRAERTMEPVTLFLQAYLKAALSRYSLFRIRIVPKDEV